MWNLQPWLEAGHALLADLGPLLIAFLAAFSALSLLDPFPPERAGPRWIRRLLASLLLLTALLGLEMPALATGRSALPGAALALAAAGSAWLVLSLDRRDPRPSLHALVALPGAALLAAAQIVLAERSGGFAARHGLGTAWAATALALAGASCALALLAQFRRRRDGSPLTIAIAAPLLLVAGLFGHALSLAAHPVRNELSTTASLTLALLGTVLLALAIALGSRRLHAAAGEAGGLRRGGRADPVTGLPLLDAVAESFARVQRLCVASAHRCAVIVVELAALARVLSTQGKAERDRLYALAAWRLRSLRRDEELLGALSEDRFVLVLRVQDAEEALARCREIHGRFASPLVEAGSRPLRLLPACGLSLWPEHGEDFQRLLANALVALERCPPGAVQLFHATQREQSEQRLQIETQLLQALAEGEIGLLMQPIVDASSGKVRMVELLARWNHPSLGPIAPNEFIMIAESTGAIGHFDRWLLRQAIGTCKWLEAAGFPDIRVALNCSPINLLDPDYLREFEEVLERSHMDPARLELEITEAALAQREREVIDSLVRLRVLGVGLTIDDFGIGHSSLARLRDLPVDTLKIDQSFVRDMDHPAGEFLVEGILGLAHGLGKRVIAEGIETPAQRQALVAMGCEYLQGFLISRPLTWQGLLDHLGAPAGDPRRQRLLEPDSPPPPMPPR